MARARDPQGTLEREQQRWVVATSKQIDAQFAQWLQSKLTADTTYRVVQYRGSVWRQTFGTCYKTHIRACSGARPREGVRFE